MFSSKLSAKETSPMVSESPRSPNAIPPRTSSTGQNPINHVPSKPVLKPVAEGDWISQRKRVSTSSTSTTTVIPAGSPPDPSRYKQNDLAFHGRSSWSNEKEKILLGPYEYLYAHPGKDVRTQLIAAFNEWLEVPPASLEIITKVVGMLHTASLLVDDVEDSSFLRRGLPVAHSIFGTAQTINSANYVYFCGLQELQKLRNPKAIEIYTEELLNLHRGQGMDLFWRDTLTCPSEDDYLEMVGNKTGGLFRLAVKLMQAESKSTRYVSLLAALIPTFSCSRYWSYLRNTRDCVPLVNLIGIIFQIRDDYLNLCSPTMTTNKGLCEDLTEGKFSFPILHSIRTDPANLQLLNILKQKTTDEEVKRYAVKYMESTGSFEYCRKVLKTLGERARKLVIEVESVEDAGLEEGKEGGVMRILEKMAV
jgi:geranylgeranyl diphosphate synthase type 3